MEEKIIEEYIDNSCRKYGLLYIIMGKKIVMKSENEIRIHINTNQKFIHFNEYISDVNINNYMVSCTVNGKYRFIDSKEKIKDFDYLESAIDCCIKTIISDLEKRHKLFN